MPVVVRYTAEIIVDEAKVWIELALQLGEVSVAGEGVELVQYVARVVLAPVGVTAVFSYQLLTCYGGIVGGHVEFDLAHGGCSGEAGV